MASTMVHLADSTACLDENGVTAYLAGQLSQNSEAGVQRHLDTCPKCQSVVAQVVTATADAMPRPSLLSAELAPGQLVGRYRVVRKIGEGAMGVVYLGLDPVLNRPVALKLLRVRASNDQAEERLKREAAAMAQLTHGNVCSVFDVCSDDRGSLCIVMEFIDGAHLRSHLLLTASGWRPALALVLAAGDGLAAAHARGIVHRDFKPDNVLVAADGRVCVTDFGLAGTSRRSDEDTLDETPAGVAAGSTVWWPDRERRLTRPGTVLGTPAYMAPEVHRGEPATPLSDQFSFAVSAWECLHGDRPFSARALEQLRRGGRPEPRPVRRTPRRIRRALLRAMDPQPSRRYPDMTALLADLREPPPLRRIGLAALAALALVALLLAAGPLGSRLLAWLAGGAAP